MLQFQVWDSHRSLGHLITHVQFDRLIEELLPVLHIHFLRQGVKSSMFCSQWFLTLFSYRSAHHLRLCVTKFTVFGCRFPLDIAFRIYDNCLASGIEAIFGFSIVLLQKNEDALLTLKFDEILAFMKTRVFEKYKVSVNLSLLLDKLIVPLLTDRTVWLHESRKRKRSSISGRWIRSRCCLLKNYSVHAGFVCSWIRGSHSNPRRSRIRSGNFATE